MYAWAWRKRKHGFLTDWIVFNNKENKPDLQVHRMTHMLPKYPALVATLSPLGCKLCSILLYKYQYTSLMSHYLTQNFQWFYFKQYFLLLFYKTSLIFISLGKIWVRKSVCMDFLNSAKKSIFPVITDTVIVKCSVVIKDLFQKFCWDGPIPNPCSKLFLLVPHHEINLSICFTLNRLTVCESI